MEMDRINQMKILYVSHLNMKSKTFQSKMSILKKKSLNIFQRKLENRFLELMGPHGKIVIPKTHWKKTNLI